MIQNNHKKIGILLTNTGTPEALNIHSVRRYLKTFLSDKRVVKLPRLIWLPILYGLILPFRAKKSLKLYQKIWTDSGSPMQIYMQKIEKTLHATLNQLNGVVYDVRVGMHYSKPSIKAALNSFAENNIDTIIALPLYPQYSNTTTAASFDQIAKELKHLNRLPTLYFIRSYADHDAYISALANSVKNFWQENSKSDCLLISFHGIPERFVKAGDIYQAQCEQTAGLLAKKLCLHESEWKLCYQSQFGYDKWLKPSTQELLLELPKSGIKNIDVVCPGFSVDCLETLEEIAITGRESFKDSGGEELRYIPALNDSSFHIEMLKSFIKSLIEKSFE